MIWWIIGIYIAFRLADRIIAIANFLAVAFHVSIICLSPDNFSRKNVLQPIMLKLQIIGKAIYPKVITKTRSMFSITQGINLFFLLIYSGYPIVFGRNVTRMNSLQTAN